MRAYVVRSLEKIKLYLNLFNENKKLNHSIILAYI